MGAKINDSDFEKQSSFAHRDKNYLSELQTYWKRASQTEKMVKAFNEVQQIFMLIKNLSQSSLELSFLHIIIFILVLHLCIVNSNIHYSHSKKRKMEKTNKSIITVENTILAPVQKVWELWTTPRHITKWNNASDDWHTPFAENDLRVGGKFLSRMEAKDSSFGFDFGGVYDEVKPNELITYTIGDGRKVTVIFSSIGNETKVTTTFETEDTNPIEMQRGGWQAILDNFKKYAETN